MCALVCPHMCVEDDNLQGNLHISVFAWSALRPQSHRSVSPFLSPVLPASLEKPQGKGDRTRGEKKARLDDHHRSGGRRGRKEGDGGSHRGGYPRVDGAARPAVSEPCPGLREPEESPPSCLFLHENTAPTPLHSGLIS